MNDIEHFVPPRDATALVVVDIQERFFPAMEAERKDTFLENTKLLLKFANTMGLPVLVTEQYPQGIGPTHEEVGQLIRHQTSPIIKDTMSCCGCPSFLDDLEKSGRKQIIVCGIEAHVCVLQTALDLLAGGFQVHLCADATGSRRTEDYKTAIPKSLALLRKAFS